MTKKNTTIYFLFVVAIFFLLHQSISAQQKSLAEARLVVNSFNTEKDSIISLGVLINLQDDWHIYWRNPGDSGMPTDIEFKLPKGVTASDIKFPVPEIFVSDEIMNYVYSHQVLLTSELSIPKDYPKKEISITAKLTSLICKDLCKAFDTTVTIKLDISKSYIAETNISDLFESTKNLLPQKNHSLKTSATSISDSVYLKVNGDEINNASSIRFLSYESGMFRNLINQNTIKKENHLELILEPDPFRVKNPTEVNGIIILNDDHSKAYEIKLPIIN
jgi:thiol:disulfide interchange protein DsbD